LAFWNRQKSAPDPIFGRLEHAHAELALATIERELSMMEMPVSEAGPLMPPANGGRTAPSPFVEATAPSRSVLPWRRGQSHALEAAPALPQPPKRQVARLGYVNGLPIGGTTPTNSGMSSTPGAPDRQTAMTELLQAYLTCPWVAVCVDGIARTITAGGLTLEPLNLDPEQVRAKPAPPPGIARIQELLDYCNPTDDIRQLMRRAVTDALIFGDAFVEVTWIGNEPVALWPLDCQSMSVIADEHGNIGKEVDGKLVAFVQMTDTGKRVNFEPHEVIHVKLDSPGASLYGVSPTTKASVPIKTWLFAAGLIKETMKRGDPPRLHVDFPFATPPPEIEKKLSQYAARNLGTRNIGNLFTTEGGASSGIKTSVTELSQNKLDYWMAVLDGARNDILSTYGVPPRKAGVMEPGSLGGQGAESGQDKTFRVTTCGPTSELVLEKFTFALCYQAYGVKDWRISFSEVDWRDDLVIEEIRDMRLRNGSWTANRYRDDISEPPIEGGDDPVLIERQNITLWADLSALSKASVAAKGKGTSLDPTPQQLPTQPQVLQPPPEPPPEAEDDPEARLPGEHLAEYIARKSNWRAVYEQRRRVRVRS
jgi:hypothetical protein